MKYSIRIGLWQVLCLLMMPTLLSCGREVTYPPALVRADSLIENGRPFEAVQLLTANRRQVSHWDEAARMRYYLLRFKARDLTESVHREDKNLLPMLQYYTAHPRECDLAEVYYYAARVYQDVGDALQALDLYEKALAGTDDEGLRRDAFIRMGAIYGKEELYEEAIDLCLQALDIDSIRGDTALWTYDCRDLASLYKALGQYNEATAYYLKAGRNKMLKRFSQMGLAEIEYERGDYTSAWRRITPILRTNQNSEDSRLWLLAGKLCYRRGHSDAAQEYLSIVTQHGDAVSRKEAYRYIACIDAGEGGLLRQYIAFADAAEAESRQEALLRKKALYNYSQKERENALMQEEMLNRRTQFMAIVAGLVIACLLLAVSLLLIRRKRSTIAGLRQSIDALNEKYDSEHVRLERLQREEFGRRKALRHSRGAVASSEAYTLVREHLASRSVIPDEEWPTIQQTLSEVYPDFYRQLMSWKINAQETRICLLMKMEFPQSEIAVLTGRTDEAVSSSKRRMCQKVLGTEPSASEWNKYIDSL